MLQALRTKADRGQLHRSAAYYWTHQLSQSRFSCYLELSKAHRAVLARIPSLPTQCPSHGLVAYWQFTAPLPHDITPSATLHPQPSDLEALLASLPSLTALHLDAAPSLLPCVSSLVPLASRLQRLCITRSYHRLDTPEGAADAASLSSLSLLTHLELSLDPPTADGLSRIPDAWSSLSTLSSLSLVGHRRLKRLPRWLPGSLKRLEVVVLEACGFKAMPAEALGPLPLLRVLSLSRSPLGEGEAAVALDAWWPPGGGGKAGGAWSEEGGSSGDGGGGALQGPAGGGSGQEEGGTPVTEAGSFFPVNAGVQAGLSGLEVLRLADCGILALPYAVTQ